VAASTTPPSYIRVRAIVFACGRGQTDRQTDRQTHVTTIHFASSTTHAKCNNQRGLVELLLDRRGDDIRREMIEDKSVVIREYEEH